MKTLVTFLTLALLVMLLGSCNYKIMKYKVDPTTGKEKLMAYNEYSYNMSPEMVEADYNSDIMKGIAAQVSPRSKADNSLNVYMSEAGALAGMEIGGRYYQSKGYGRKRISSRDGTVVGSITSTNGTNDYEGTPYYYNKRGTHVYYQGQWMSTKIFEILKDRGRL